MLKFLNSLFDENKKHLKRYQKIVDQINALESGMKKLSDEKLAKQTKKFRALIKEKQAQNVTDQDILNQILPEAYATVREVSRRTLGMRHFDVQLLAGIALHEGKITEQKTGEGKTLTVTLPLYLNALLKKGAHLVTVNDYLAEIGTGWMGPIYHFLGLSTAVIVHEKSSLFDPEFEAEARGDERLEHFRPITRQDAYAADITYGTNNEFGFDYLRDNMVQSIEQMVQRSEYAHQFAIVDEADSILIDEARTPLIISAPEGDNTKQYYEYAQMVRSLSKDIDYVIDEKAKTASLTDLGVKRLERKLGVKNLYEESFDTIHHLESALKATSLFQRDKDYIVRDNKVIIVDEHTGRLMFGRRYSDGLHQAIEAKEAVEVQKESRTLATISIQNYFRLYQKLAGMTGTAETEAEEFKEIYGIDVVVVPTNEPIIRQDKGDIVYKTAAAKYSAIVREIEKLHAKGQPILIGTRSITHNQIIADFLKRKKIPHQVLNAKNHEREAFIIADAGKKGAITVATNIAGRGVDIVLGGAKPELKDFRKKHLTTKQELSPEIKKLAKTLKLPPAVNPNHYKLKQYQKSLEEWRRNHEEVVSLGGLYILGTERHESRRIDNQLRGRAGRQGDPGASQFFVALEDEIMRIFGGEQISKIMDFLKIDEGQPIEHGVVSKSIESAQKKVEGFFFDQRKRLVEYDDVMNKQREIIYDRRRRLLREGTVDQTNQEDLGLKTQILDYVDHEIEALASFHAPVEFIESEYRELVKEFAKVIPFDDNSLERIVQEVKSLNDIESVTQKLKNIARSTYDSKEQTVGATATRHLERLVLLSTLDEKWMDHLDAMEALKEGIWMRGDKRTVLSEYKKEGFIMFESLLKNIESTVAKRIFRVQPTSVMQAEPTQFIEQKEATPETIAQEVAEANLANPNPSSTNVQSNLGGLAAALKTAKATHKPQPGAKKIKIGRNDPCPCGSGKKYKKCGLINSEEHRRRTGQI